MNNTATIFYFFINVFTIILNFSILFYYDRNISEAVLRDMNFTEAILNVFSPECTDVSDALLNEVYDPVNLI